LHLLTTDVGRTRGGWSVAWTQVEVDAAAEDAKFASCDCDANETTHKHKEKRQLFVAILSSSSFTHYYLN
jgi:hypothetical protein